ncbi:MAG: RHS repeat-associated core domain-containing protein [Fimbriimonas sp.]
MNLNSRFYRVTATVMAFAMINLAAPQGVVTLFAPDPNAPKPAPEVKKEPKLTRLLSAKVMKTSQGRVGGNPYLAGQNKWDIVQKGVNLMSGGYSTSATDLTYESGYGIPVNITRSYSSNNPDEGPLGWGWTLSVDVRSTVGGVLKSNGAPVRSIPTSFKERPSGDNDPRVADANEPVDAVVATDAGNFEEVIQKDVDGVLTTPPWDKNVIDSEYELVTHPTTGAIYNILKKNVVKTPEGTVYHYSKHGAYAATGMTPRSGGATGQPSNVLKIDKAVDRHGNETLYTYATTGQVTFAKSNGSTTEDRLVEIAMPNGHHIAFEWNGNRVAKAKDLSHSGTTVLREVTYGYTNGFLTSVTTPAGKVTSYGYGSAVTNSGSPSFQHTGLLRTIIDPRGLTTTMSYISGAFGSTSTAAVYRIDAPNGCVTLFDFYGFDLPPGQPFNFSQSNNVCVMELDSNLAMTDIAGINYGNVQNSDEYFVDVNHNNDWWTGSPVPASTKRYSVWTQDLIWEKSYTYPIANPYGIVMPQMKDLAAERRAVSPSWQRQAVETATVYNFMGNPLSKTAVESQQVAGVWSNTASRTTGYSYWGADKYFQQKIVKDPAGRYSMTDYYTSSDAQGFKGQAKTVYDERHADYGPISGWTAPPGTPSGDQWRYTYGVTSGVPAAEFPLGSGGEPNAYDTKGRTTRVRKLQKVVAGTPTYVETRTTFGADVATIWGQAIMVTEAYGTPSARTTETLEFTPEGKAKKLKDANGRILVTNYDADGVVQSVERIMGGVPQPVATYTYGTTGLLNGQPTQVVDNLSGVTLTFTYASTGAGIGQLAGVSQSNGTWSWPYSVSYTYGADGLRGRVTYDTPNGITKWEYLDYTRVGNPLKGSRVFQTLRKLNGSNQGTDEEMHYCYDSQGRLTNAMFAQVRQTGSGTPSSAPYYTQNHPAASRARAYYAFDPAGRALGVKYWWDVWGGSNYSSPSYVFENTCVYDATKGLKTSSTFAAPSAPSGFNHTEIYGYESERDFLTSVNYADGLPNATPSWTYDASQNRSNSGYAYDELSRMSASPGWTYTHDAAGNRLAKENGSGAYTAYTWDALNRMTACFDQPRTHYSNFEYRSDGLRSHKAVDRPNQSAMHEASRYDGQMPFELERYVENGGLTATRSTLGARGIDAEETATGTYSSSTGHTTSSFGNTSYPLYDAHGNRICTLTRSGANSYTTDSPRTFGAWGEIRLGAQTGGSTSRYCANLGHVQDDESGLVYMRSRYYDLQGGRFLNQDIERDGLNWYVYAANNPIGKVDVSGDAAAWNAMSYAELIAAINRARFMPPVRAVAYLFSLLGEIASFAQGVLFEYHRLEAFAFEAEVVGNIRAAEVWQDLATKRLIGGRFQEFAIRAQWTVMLFLKLEELDNGGLN